jgi:hypothetical protein
MPMSEIFPKWQVFSKVSLQDDFSFVLSLSLSHSPKSGSNTILDIAMLVSDIHEHCGIHTPQYVDDEGIEIRPNEIQENQDQEVKDGYYRRLICNYILFAFCCLLPGGIMYLVLTTANYSLLLTNANYLLLLTTNYCPITLLTANYY